MKKEGTLKGANTPRRNALGRGLSALMSATQAVRIDGDVKAEANEDEVKTEAVRSEKVIRLPQVSESEPVDKGLVYLGIEQIQPNAQQPRKHFDEAELKSLADSIKESGLLQPVIVRKNRGENGPLAGYELVAGERRFRASKLAGLTKIPAIVRTVSDKEAFALAVVENVQREDLNPIEEAEAYQRLIEEFGETQASVALAVGLDRASVANSLRLLKLDSEVKKLLATGRLSAGHGRALLMADTPEEQRNLAARILSESLSVRAAEKLSGVGATRSRTAQPSAPAEKAPAVRALEERLRRALGTKVALNVGESGAGELKISFFSREEFETLLERLGA